MSQETKEIEIKEVNKSKVRLFLKVTIILAVVTAIEYVVAFTVPHEYKMIRVSIFILLTIVKAYYIVGVFMHLLFEKKPLKMSIVLPMAFIVFLLFVLIYQGDAVFDLLTGR